MSKRPFQIVTSHPTSSAPGVEPINTDILSQGVSNALQAKPLKPRKRPLETKSIRLPRELIDYIDYTYSPKKRMNKSAAYIEALEAFFGPYMRGEKELP